MSYKPERRRIVGPTAVIASGSRYVVIDRGDGSIILPTKFKTRAAADKWVAKKRLALLNSKVTPPHLISDGASRAQVHVRWSNGYVAIVPEAGLAVADGS